MKRYEPWYEAYEYVEGEYVKTEDVVKYLKRIVQMLNNHDYDIDGVVKNIRAKIKELS